ncbi:MAG: phosphate signaling complex protein PhoU [Desulfuromonadales bacterium]|nr:phosphate signaling complex protein PhoU [Desulfuromonadales bacterium]
MKREHISKQYDEELSELREKLLEMGGKVELMINDSIKVLIERDSDLAGNIVAFDHEINRLEMTIDEKCLGILARRQPTAKDLRFITLALKIVTDLERIGDQCRNIARKARELNSEPILTPYVDLPFMTTCAAKMVKEALDAFVSADVELAMKVCNEDNIVDDLNEKVQLKLLEVMTANSSAISGGMKINYIAKCIERIADHATNVAEMVIFMVKGKDIRHTTTH